MQEAAALDLDLNEVENPDILAAEAALGAFDKLAIMAQASGDISHAIETQRLADIGADVVEDYETDNTDREEWLTTVKEALERAAQEKKPEPKTTPWPNASNIDYPILTTAALQFNARALGAIIKGDEAISVKVVGKDVGRPEMDPMGQPVMQPGPDGQPQPMWRVPPGGKAARAGRVRDYLNTVLFYRMDDWESDTDALLLALPIVGCVFRKVFYDPRTDEHKSVMVPAVRVVVPKDARSCETTPRLTEEVPGVYPHEIMERMRDGTYREVDLFGIGTGEAEEALKRADKPRLLLEQMRLIDFDEDGLPEPYIVTVDHETRNVLRIEPNFSPDDIKQAPDGRVLRIERGQYFVKYDFFPHPEGKFYGIGLGHLLKNIGAVINTAINQMMDAGQAQIAGGGFIGSGVRLTGAKRSGSLRFAPGEYKTVDVSGGQLRDALVERTFPQPSQITYNILDMMLGAAKDISSVKDVITGDASNNGQVGTTLALIEQGLQVFSAIYKRIYRSLKCEFSMLYRNVAKYASDDTRKDYAEVLDDEQADFDRDFNQRDMDIRPVSDPASVTRMQKMARAQFLGGFVNLPWVNGPEITKRMLEAADVEDTDALFVQMQPPQPNPKDVAQAQKYEAGAVLDMEKAQTEQAKRDQMAVDSFAKTFGAGVQMGLA